MEGSLDIKLSIRESSQRREKVIRKKSKVRRKVAKHCDFPVFLRKRLPKAAGAEPSGRMRDQKLHVAVAQSTIGSQHAKKLMFGARCEAEKAGTVVAGSACRSQNVQSTSFLEHLELELLKKCTPVTARSEVKPLKAYHLQSSFGNSDVEKTSAAVTRSTFGSENGQNTTASEYFWKLRG